MNQAERAYRAYLESEAFGKARVAAEQAARPPEEVAAEAAIAEAAARRYSDAINKVIALTAECAPEETIRAFIESVGKEQ